MIKYVIPEGVQTGKMKQPSLITPQGGQVVVDSDLLHIWEYANGRDLKEITSHFSVFPEKEVWASVACLSEAGLLSRVPENPQLGFPLPCKGKLISVIIVGYAGIDWLRECIPSILGQTYQPIEIIVVDNASPQPLEPWIRQEFPAVDVLSLHEPATFAQANNRGIEKAKGDAFLLLNQDTRLEPDAIAELVLVLENNPCCAGVAPKLRFTWAPAFLNGIGNRVNRGTWGSDNGIGHLDLGQFDHWQEIPSICFAAALIHRGFWREIGPLDEQFPMYYEDVEWGYRARLLGFDLLAAPRAVVYHAFSGRIPSGKRERISPRKLKNVVYGRYRFVLKLLDQQKWDFLGSYLISDLAYFLKAVLQTDFNSACAYVEAWWKVVREASSLRNTNLEWNSKRRMNDQSLFSLQINLPHSFLWNGLPELTFRLVKTCYLPLLEASLTRKIVEFTKPEQDPA